MAKSSSLMLPQNANNGSVSFTNADTTTLKTVFTAGANDSDVKSLVASSDDTAAINVKIWINRSGTDYLLAVVNVPITSGGLGTISATDLLSLSAIPGLPLDSIGKQYIPLKNGELLKVSCLATMTAAKTLYINALGQDY